MSEQICESCGARGGLRADGGRIIMLSMEPGPDGQPWCLCKRCHSPPKLIKAKGSAPVVIEAEPEKPAKKPRTKRA